jgi:5,10-methylenetetrahydromethanopterin reductase
VSGAPRTCVWAFPDRPAPELVDAIFAAEEAGIDEFWLGDEGPAREPFSVLSAAAGRTSRIRLAVGITNPYVRNPALACTTAQTIAELSGGRFTLGIGAGGALSLGPLQQEAPRPLSAVRSMLRIARAVEAGDPTEGFDPGPEALGGQGVPVFVGAKGERLNRLASEVADGVFVAGPPMFTYDELLGWARSVRPVDVVLCPSVLFDAEDLEAFRPRSIVGVRDAPAEVRRRLGLDDAEVDRAAAAFLDGDPEAARSLMTDDAVAELVLIGDERAVGARLAELVRRHEPTTIGLALLHGDLHENVAAAGRTFDALRHELDGSPTAGAR